MKTRMQPSGGLEQAARWCATSPLPAAADALEMDGATRNSTDHHQAIRIVDPYRAHSATMHRAARVRLGAASRRRPDLPPRLHEGGQVITRSPTTGGLDTEKVKSRPSRMAYRPDQAERMGIGKLGTAVLPGLSTAEK